MNDEAIMLLLSIVGLIVALLIVFSFGYDVGKTTLINSLCSKQQYDFCVVDTYKLKGEE